MKYSLDQIDGNIPLYSGIYFIYDGEDIVYIGQAQYIKHRFDIIRLFRRFLFLGFTHTQYIYINKEDLNRVEKDLIKMFAPKYNKSNHPSRIRKIYQAKKKKSNWVSKWE